MDPITTTFDTFDDGRNPVTAERTEGFWQCGFRCAIPHYIALGAAQLAVALTPGEAVVGHHVRWFTGETLLAAGDGSLDDGNELRAAVVVAYNPNLNQLQRYLVERDEALDGDGAPITDAEIAAAIPTTSYNAGLWIRCGDLRWVRSGTVVTLEIEQLERAYGVLSDIKDATGVGDAVEPTEGDQTSGYFEGQEVIAFSLDFADVADGALATFGVRHNGRLSTLRVVTEKAPVGASGTTTVGLQRVRGASVGDATLDFATGGDGGSLGDVQEASLTPITVRPGDQIQIDLSATGGTLTSGRLRIEALIDVLKG